ncbi:BAG family molecular chaperone regulator 4 isoform X1 [Cucurbita maxima]|uniref:BAG family molecular chaperone regulator 4 isoform X1 n=1 Tax=Cucurbita maxima TaxID=3661 RepID=A0A6J1ITL4_CUCMA|nr:BAG family molecular chaperone regulator 4 isoform X1 [Cucurbita maxima]XP_022978255.1 BAG family molecular chaperone regulator 4 isoform X1 [Cucurbita maxima]
MTGKNSYPSGSATVQDEKNHETELDMRPGGMFVQKREVDNGADVSSSDAMISISVTHGYGPTKYKIFLPPQSTFGDMKKHLVAKTGLQPEEQRLLFRGKEKDDDEHLHTAGVKNLSKILLLEDHTSKQKVVEDVKMVEEVKKSDTFSKASEAIAEVQSEVDKLSERVAAIEVAVNGGTNIADKEFIVLTELLMRQLLKLDSIDAEGDAKLQRKAEVRRVQNFVDTLDALKAGKSNPISNKHNTVAVKTEWETFDSGVGSLTPPSPAPSSTRVTQDWERFD